MKRIAREIEELFNDITFAERITPTKGYTKRTMAKLEEIFVDIAFMEAGAATDDEPDYTGKGRRADGGRKATYCIGDLCTHKL